MPLMLWDLSNPEDIKGTFVESDIQDDLFAKKMLLVPLNSKHKCKDSVIFATVELYPDEFEEHNGTSDVAEMVFERSTRRLREIFRSTIPSHETDHFCVSSDGKWLYHGGLTSIRPICIEPSGDVGIASSALTLLPAYHRMFRVHHYRFYL
jgi:hypothetical protein